MDQNRPMTKRERQEAKRLERLASSATNKGSDTVKWLIIGVGSILFLALFGLVIFLIKKDQSKPVVLSADGHVKGAQTAKVTLVEYGDFQCPACKAYEPFVRQLSKEFEGKMKFMFKHFPLTQAHPNAMLAAKVSIASSNQNKFWEMHDWLYDNQDSWAGLPGADAKAKMVEQAKVLKLNMEQFNKDIDSSETSQTIQKNQDEGIMVGVSATPTFFINNKKVEPNPPNYEEFKKLIQAEVNKTK